jgi:hypothetical protein
VANEEKDEFFQWLLDRWEGWRLPVLFLEVKGRWDAESPNLHQRKHQD